MTNGDLIMLIFLVIMTCIAIATVIYTIKEDIFLEHGLSISLVYIVIWIYFLNDFGVINMNAIMHWLAHPI